MSQTKDLDQGIDGATRDGRGIDLGLSVGPGSGPAMLDLVELLATRLLVQGNSGSGKSHLLRRLLEQSAGLVQQIVIDPEGDFVTLSERFGHVVVDADGDEAALQAIAARVREHRVSVVLNLEHCDVEGQMRAAASFLGGLFEADRAAVPRAQRPSGDMRSVPELGDGALDAQPRRVPHDPGGVEDVRHRLPRDAGDARDVLDGRCLGHGRPSYGSGKTLTERGCLRNLVCTPGV